MIEATLFLTGAQRSGTTLLEKLLGAQQRVSMLSQPFPLLFSHVKRAFLGGEDRYPLGHLFLESRYSAGDFGRFLAAWRTSRGELESLFARMESYSGQYTRFARAQLDDAIDHIPEDADFADVLSTLDRFLASKHSATWFGSKETTCEEYVPPLLARGVRCAIILRDPRDIVASLNHGRGREFGGDLKPTLFNVRAWRKSVAVALAMQEQPRFHWCRYEDLVADPARELIRLAAALGLGDLDATRDFAEIREADGQVWRGNSSHGELHGVAASSIAAWREILPPDAAEIIEAACLPELQLLGYETTLSRTAARQVLERLHEPYTITRIGMQADAATPENARLEIERLDRVAAGPDGESARWFLFPRTHAALAGAFRG